MSALHQQKQKIIKHIQDYLGVNGGKFKGFYIKDNEIVFEPRRDCTIFSLSAGITIRNTSEIEDASIPLKQFASDLVDILADPPSVLKKEDAVNFHIRTWDKNILLRCFQKHGATEKRCKQKKSVPVLVVDEEHCCEPAFIDPEFFEKVALKN